MPQHIAQRIKERRKELGLSQDSLAKACSVGQSTVANWESGSHIPRQASLTKIAKALDTNDIWLLSGEQSKKNNSLEAYLQKPVRHVPVLKWPLAGQILDTTHPDTYVPLSSHHKNLFGLTLDSEIDEFKAGTVLIFAPCEPSDEMGYFLENVDSLYKLTSVFSEAVTARLVYSFTRH